MDSSLSVSVTFPEGIRLVDAADLLEENNVCDADEFLDHFNHDSKFGYAYEDHLPSFQDEKFYQMEGYLFPDTYTFYQEMDVELVCQKILENFNDKITKDMYDRMDALNVTLDQTITLASMIQAEAGNTEQMATISSVFWNRLNNATEYPLLQSDPTTKYVEEVIKPHSESYNEDLYTSYDTYQCTGLPAGPICNPGIEAIQAALYPDNTNYYFFYSNIDTKETYFRRDHRRSTRPTSRRCRNSRQRQRNPQPPRKAARRTAMAQRNKPELLAPAGESGTPPRRRWTTAQMPSIWDGKASVCGPPPAISTAPSSCTKPVHPGAPVRQKGIPHLQHPAPQRGDSHVSPVPAGGTGSRRRCPHPGRPGTAGNGTEAGAGYGDPHVHTDRHRQLQPPAGRCMTWA